MAEQKDYSKKIFTVPNVISMIRIAMIPVFAWAYLAGHGVTALVIVVLSGISDKLDGTIARKFNMISNVGKWLDPAADKLTQVTLALVMFLKFHGSAEPWLVAFSWVFLAFIGKELFMLCFALLMLLLKKRPAAAEVWGKAATAVFYVVMGLLFLCGPEVGVISQWFALPELAVKIAVYVNLVLTIIAFLSYFPDTYRKLFKEGKA